MNTALGVEVLAHEAFHLRNVPGNYSEKITECRAFRHYDVAFRRLGAEPAVLDRLMVLAIMHHYLFVHEVPDYDLKDCSPPARYDRWIGDR